MSSVAVRCFATVMLIFAVALAATWRQVVRSDEFEEEVTVIETSEDRHPSHNRSVHDSSASDAGTAAAAAAVVTTKTTTIIRRGPKFASPRGGSVTTTSKTTSTNEGGFVPLDKLPEMIRAQYTATDIVFNVTVVEPRARPGLDGAATIVSAEHDDDDDDDADDNADVVDGHHSVPTSGKNLAAPSGRPQPKVAVCFFGLVKNISRKQAAAYTKYLIQPLRTAGFDPVGFLHTFDMSNQPFSNKRNHEEKITFSQRKSISQLRKLFKGEMLAVSEVPGDADSYFGPHRHLLRNGHPWPGHPTSLTFYLRQLYSLMRVTELWSRVTVMRRFSHPMLLRNNYGKLLDFPPLELPVNGLSEYACVVYVRPDTLLGSAIPQAALAALCPHTNHHLSYPVGPVSHFGDRHVGVPRFEFGGLHDRFAFGTPMGMAIYGMRGLLLRKYVSKGRKPHAETFLFHTLCENRVAVHLVPVVSMRIRGHGGTPDLQNTIERRRFTQSIVPQWAQWVNLTRGRKVGGRQLNCMPVSTWMDE